MNRRGFLKLVGGLAAVAPLRTVLHVSKKPGPTHYCAVVILRQELVQSYDPGDLYCTRMFHALEGFPDEMRLVLRDKGYRSVFDGYCFEFEETRKSGVFTADGWRRHFEVLRGSAYMRTKWQHRLTT